MENSWCVQFMYFLILNQVEQKLTEEFVQLHFDK